MEFGGFGPRSMFPIFRDLRYDQRRGPNPMGIVPDRQKSGPKTHSGTPTEECPKSDNEVDGHF